MNMTGKRLIVLGGTSASFDLVRNAKEMGIYTIVTDPNETGVSKEIADETAKVSTADIDGLVKLAKEKSADGIFCGPSEFNLRNVIKACAAAGLPCYTTMDVWDNCANKDVFKSFCRKYDVDCTPEYDITLETPESELKKIDYPIIIKPVDGSSSAGISVCKTADDVYPALEKAYAASKSGRIIAEKYIENGGELFSVRYMLKDGEAYPYFLMDTYVADPVHRTSLISGYTHAPSKYSKYYLENMDSKVRKMLKGMGLKNGTAFIQSLPYEGKIYFHEMGYRLSGGMIFKLTNPLSHVHDMKMMLRFAVGGESITEEEIGAIDVSCGGRIGGQLMMPLKVGTIGKIEGVERIKENKNVVDFLQYYKVGDSIEQKVIGTLGQHFGRITFIVDSQEEEIELIRYFQEKVRIYDTNGNLMNVLKFDTKRF